MSYITHNTHDTSSRDIFKYTYVSLFITLETFSHLVQIYGSVSGYVTIVSIFVRAYNMLLSFLNLWDWNWVILVLVA